MLDPVPEIAHMAHFRGQNRTSCSSGLALAGHQGDHADGGYDSPSTSYRR
ncbi:MAG: hypothetical protein KF884_08620 [Fimbriimonadaceae bacterium]|nr:hypothetical protein [Fimbriimonadaceae bacterium]QYK57613.1 MAG: hypothetical protein KF884_08620 [Fimbriimonadaceae bacterium]